MSTLIGLIGLIGLSTLMPTVATYGVAWAQLNTKTTKLGVAGRGDEDGLRLEVPVDDIVHGF